MAIFSWNKIKKPIIALAPMADYTDSPFCLICKKFGADIVYREMVSAEAIVRGNKKTLQMAAFDKKERPIILQIFGKNPGVMAEAARILEEKYRPDGIDINMGCPAKKITSDFNGASLMREPKLAAEIVRAVKGAARMPVSVKTRLGWDKETEILDFAPLLEEAGADAIAIHCRTKKMGFAGRANWKILKSIKEKSRIPLLINGDIIDFSSFKRALEESGADGALIGRGALGNPWIFQNISAKGLPAIASKALQAGGSASGGKKKKDAAPPFEEIKKIVFEHAKLHNEHCGKNFATFRKHLVAYFKGVKNASRIRSRLVKISSLGELTDFLKGT